MVVRIGRNQEGLVPQAHEIILPREAQDALVVNIKSIALQSSGDPAVPVGRELERDALHAVGTSISTRLLGHRYQPAIIAGPA
jgi:hypothetical protein